MASCYVAFDPNMLHSPLSFEIQAKSGRDKLGAHAISQQFQYLLVHSLSAADTAHVGCTHLTHLALFGSSTIPVPLRHVPGITLSIWLLWELRRHEGLPLVGDPAFARIERLVCSRSPVRFLLPLHEWSLAEESVPARLQPWWFRMS
jgi:hypothetical protein